MKDNKNSPAKIAANNRYTKSHYKQLKINIKPETADEIKETAAAEGQSVTSYLVGLHKKHISDKEHTDV